MRRPVIYCADIGSVAAGNFGWARGCGGEAGSGLFLWEAFVSGKAKTGSNIGDAKAAVRAFAELWPEIPAAEVARGTQVHSLIGAALLRSGWSEEVALLRTPCSVVKVMPPHDA